VLALAKEKGKKHAIDNAAWVGEPPMRGYKARCRGKHPSKRQYVSHKLSSCGTICSLLRASCTTCFDALGKPSSCSEIRGSPHSIIRRRHCTPIARRQFWRIVRAGASSPKLPANTLRKSAPDCRLAAGLSGGERRCARVSTAIAPSVPLAWTRSSRRTNTNVRSTSIHGRHHNAPGDTRGC
jgi:hypothetical protein